MRDSFEPGRRAVNYFKAGLAQLPQENHSCHAPSIVGIGVVTIFGKTVAWPFQVCHAASIKRKVKLLQGSDLGKCCWK